MNAFPFPVEAVIFDMDGLLLDTENVYRRAMIASALGLGYDFPEDFCHSMVGAAETEIHLILRQRFGADFPIPKLFQDCEVQMQRLLDAGVPVKAGAAELIGDLAARKLPMAVATSTIRRIAEHHLQRAGLLDHFNAVCTREDVARGKPHPEPVLLALSRFDCNAEDTLFVGDSTHDIEAGNAAGVCTAAATWGPFTRQQLEASSPTFWLERPVDVLAL